MSIYIEDFKVENLKDFFKKVKKTEKEINNKTMKEEVLSEDMYKTYMSFAKSVRKREEEFKEAIEIKNGKYKSPPKIEEIYKLLSNMFGLSPFEIVAKNMIQKKRKQTQNNTKKEEIKQ